MSRLLNLILSILLDGVMIKVEVHGNQTSYNHGILITHKGRSLNTVAGVPDKQGLGRSSKFLT